MIKLRIEFLNEEDRIEILSLLQKKFEIVEEDNIKQSKLPGNKFMIQYIVLVAKGSK